MHFLCYLILRICSPLQLKVEFIKLWNTTNCLNNDANKIFSFSLYEKKKIHYEYQVRPALKPYEMKGEKDLLDNPVNSSVMEYFP